MSQNEVNLGTQKLFCCALCDHEFPSKDDLKKHERTHSGEKQFRCHYCDLTFDSSTEIQEHERTHVCPFFLKNRCVYGTRGNNENGQCKLMHPRKCIYFETSRGCKKGNSCDFFHGDSRSHSAARNVTSDSNFHGQQNRRNSYQQDRRPHYERGASKQSGYQNGNNNFMRKHLDVPPAARNSTQSGQGSSLDMAFLGETMLKVLQDHLAKIGQDNNNNALGAK